MRKFDLVAQQRLGAKSALVEEALRASLEPQQHQGIEDSLARRLDVLNRAVATVARDVVSLITFVRIHLAAVENLTHLRLKYCYLGPQFGRYCACLLDKGRALFLVEVFVHRLPPPLDEGHPERNSKTTAETISSGCSGLSALGTPGAVTQYRMAQKMYPLIRVRLRQPTSSLSPICEHAGVPVRTPETMREPRHRNRLRDCPVRRQVVLQIRFVFPESFVKSVTSGSTISRRNHCSSHICEPIFS